MTLPELLCPAGDEAALRAAVDEGADAVYLGYSRFGARASATNFDDEGLARAVRYAHLYRARVHVTVNTLVKPRELDGVREALRVIDGAGADAVIVQDLGVAKLVTDEFPRLKLHASTQMALCNATDAAWALGNGFARVVLARECSLDDIRKVVQTGVETEVFAHGALCSSVSGRCLMSSMAGGRSGNRGRCAQPCRMLYSLEEGGHKSALLSLKDLCLWRDLPALVRAGVASLKLEGRLKSAEYVAVVASVYRRALDGIAAGRFDPDDPGPMLELRQIFNRGGFTRGHAMGAQDADLCATERVGHAGVPLGRVEAAQDGFVSVRADADVNDGDSLRIEGADDVELRYSGNDVPAGLLARVRLRPGERVAAGARVARLADARQLERARAHAPKPIPVRMEAAFALGRPMRLAMSDGRYAAVAEGALAEAAKSRASTVEDARRQLAKLGGTPFVLADGAPDALTIALDDGLFLPVGALNALRRECVEKLAQARIEGFGAERDGAGTRGVSARDGAMTCGAATSVAETRGTSAQKSAATCGSTPCDAAGISATISGATARNACGLPPSHSPITPATLAVEYSDPALSLPLLDAGATLLLFDPGDLRPKPLRSLLDQLPDGAWLCLPQQADEDTLRDIAAAVRERSQKLGGVMLGSVGQSGLALPLPTLAGEGIPLTNVEAMNAALPLNLAGFTLWPEWTRDELEAMSPFPIAPLLRVYGRERLMLLNHCPERAARGLSASREGCALCGASASACARRDAALADRMGYRFPLQRVRTRAGCMLRVLGALPTLIDDNDARLRLGAGALLRFTTEPADEQPRIVSAFARWMQGGQSPRAALPDMLKSVTSGHWKRITE